MICGGFPRGENEGLHGYGKPSPENRDLTLKAKVLLSVMLSLPDDWDFTLKGLARINREGIDAIREGIRELEQAGYVMRHRVRDERGKLRGNESVTAGSYKHTR